MRQVCMENRKESLLNFTRCCQDSNEHAYKGEP
jgi:hypothetical protein